MRFISALKYQLSGFKKPLIVYYIVIYSIVILVSIPELFLPYVDVEGTWGGLEMATIIFLFVCGLNSFKPTFKMLLANGVSRMTMFKSYLTTVAAVVLATAIIDSLSSLIFSAVTNYNSLFYNFYNARYATVPEVSFQVFAEGLMWRIFAYALAAITGFFITVLYYRMNKSVKLIVSIGTPIFLFMILPKIERLFFDGFDVIYYLMAKAGFMYGYGYSPYRYVLSSAIIFVILSGLSYLLMRRSTVKE